MADEMDLIRDVISRGFADIHRRLDDQRDLNAERHSQNINALKRMDIELTTIGDTVITHTEQVKQLFARGEPITITNLRWYLTIAGAAMGGIIWLLHTLGLLK